MEPLSLTFLLVFLALPLGMQDCQARRERAEQYHNSPLRPRTPH